MRGWPRCAIREARQQLSGFLLRNGYHYHRHPWTLLYRRWMADLKFDQPLHYIVLQDCIAAVEASEQRRDRLEVCIIAALPEWSLAPLVESLQALRGIALVSAATPGRSLVTSLASAILGNSWPILVSCHRNIRADAHGGRAG